MSENIQPVPLVLFGVPFHNVTFAEAVQWVADRIRSGKPGFIATANLDLLLWLSTMKNCATCCAKRIW